MTIENIRKSLILHKGKKALIKCNLGRNKHEVYDVIIRDVYRSIFVVEMLSSVEKVKAFSYADVISKNVKIKY